MTDPTDSVVPAVQDLGNAPTDPTTAATVPVSVAVPVDEPAVAAAPVDAPEAPAVDAGTPPITPRAMDTIHQDLVAATAAHNSALQAVQDSQTALGVIKAEYESALTWFKQEEESLLASLDDAVKNADSWLIRELKKI